jgi:hypothetical protein
LADQLATAGVSERAYAENLPARPTLDAGVYAVRHNPWEYFPNAKIHVADASTLIGDLNATSPPDFVWYTPNLINDGHTGAPTDTEANQLAGTEAFLSRFIPSVQATSWYKSGGQIIIDWDEALDSDASGINGGRGGRVATIVVSNALRASPVHEATPVDSVGILRSLEDQFRLPRLANASNAAHGTIDSLLVVGSTPAAIRSITNSPRATATVGRSFAFSVTTTGTPAPKLKITGRLPKGLRFHNNRNGTATITGTPSQTTAVGVRQVTIIASYGKGKARQIVRQLFTLTVV